jgi:C_GCAxxG_C_C family probable redox protein
MLAVGRYLLGDLDHRSVAMATGFAGGTGDSRQELCGALSGGVMVIGALHGRSRLDEDDRPAIERANRYRERFLADLGEVRCSPLRERVQAPGGLGSCAVVVERAARILLDLLGE